MPPRGGRSVGEQMRSQDLRITIFENGAATSRGDLAFADERGASVVFSSSPAPALYIGQEVGIGFPGGSELSQALARVVERRDEIGSRIFGFHFENSNAWQLLMSSSLGPFFCRRREQRVKPAPAEPIWVSLTDGSGHFGHHQPMFDISLSGLGVREGMFVLLLHPLGVSNGQAIGIGLLWYLTMLLVSLLGAPAFAVGNRQHSRHFARR